MKHEKVMLFSLLLLVGSLSALSVNHAKAVTSNMQLLTYSSFFDSINTFWVAGEVNNTGTPLLSATEFVKITASYYDSGMHFINSSFTYTELDVVNPGRKSPFSVMLSENEGSLNVAHYSLSLSWDYTTTKPPGLQILSQNSYVDAIGYMHVVGEIRNVGGLYSNFTKVVATFYDSNGTVVGEDFTYTDPYDMAPGQTMPYDVLFGYRNQVPKVSSYRLTAESWQYAVLYETPDLTPPSTSDNHDGNWHNQNFTITLTATDDSGIINQTYYKIIDGPTQTISGNGQPKITMESANNTLEYWSVDPTGNEENPHKQIIGIKLDRTPPAINTITQDPQGTLIEAGQQVRVQVNATAGVSGIKNVEVTYRLNMTGSWVIGAASFNSTTGLYEYMLNGQTMGTLVQYKTKAYNNAGKSVENTNGGQYYVYTTIPEFPSLTVLTIAVATTSLAPIIRLTKRRVRT